MASNTGLYSPAFEHDSCGIGFVANIKSNKIDKCRIVLTYLPPAILDLLYGLIFWFCFFYNLNKIYRILMDFNLQGRPQILQNVLNNGLALQYASNEQLI